MPMNGTPRTHRPRSESRPTAPGAAGPTRRTASRPVISRSARDEIDGAGDQHDQRADIEREEAGLRPFGAPADADLQAADDDDQRRSSAMASATPISTDAVGRAGLAALRLSLIDIAPDVDSRRRIASAGGWHAISYLRRGSRRPSSALRGAFLRSRPTWRIRRRS